MSTARRWSPTGDEYADAYDAAVEHVAETGAVLCHAYDQPEICAGAGTLGVELLEQLGESGREVDTVLVAVGGGGLMAGVATALEGVARVVGVEPVGAPTLHDALAAGEPVDVAVSGVAADSLGARRIGSIGWEVARRTGVHSVLVEDAEIVGRASTGVGALPDRAGDRRRGSGRGTAHRALPAGGR